MEETRNTLNFGGKSDRQGNGMIMLVLVFGK
jgi:hypothetical protein